MNMQVIVRLLSVIGTVLTNRGEKELGGYAMLASVLVREGDEAVDELAALTEEIQKMVDEDRDPTEAEASAVKNRRSELSEKIQAEEVDENDQGG